MSSNRDIALRLADAGLKVFPCDWRPKSADDPSPSKKPLTEGDWQAAATCDEATIRGWWERWPEALVGLPAGLNGLLVLDPDRHGGPDGVEAFQRLAEANGGLPDGVPKVRTQSGGQHFYFKQPAQRIGCGEGALPDGINVRGRGGYVIAPGSTLADGRAWVCDDPDFALRAGLGFLPEPPGWLIAILTARKERRAPEGGALMPDDVTPEEIARLTRMAERRFDKISRMVPGTGRGTEYANLGREWGPMLNSGQLDIPEWTAKVREAMPDDPADAEHSFLNGISQSDGSGIANKLAQLRAWKQLPGVAEAIANARGLDLSADRGEAIHGPAPLRLIRPEDFLKRQVSPRKWVVPDWIPCGVVTALYGDGGIGKSLLAQQLQSACATGSAWAGQTAETVNSLGVYCEDDENELLRRQTGINSLYGCDQSSLAAVRFISRAGEDNLLMVFDRQGRGETTPFQKQILEAARDHHARLVVFDTAQDGFAGNENDRSQVRQFIGRALGEIAKAIDGAVILCAHPSRSGLSSGEGDGGSTAWSNTARSRLFFARPEDEDGAKPDENARILSRKKANYAALGESMPLLWNAGVFIAGTPEAATLRPPVESVFLDLLAAMKSEGRDASYKPRAGTYAPRIFAKRPDRRGYRMADFERAMERLFAAGSIAACESGPPSRRFHFIEKAAGPKTSGCI